MALTFEDPPLLGPRGLVGTPAGRFVEPITIAYRIGGGSALTKNRATQVAAEAWIKTSGPRSWVTQVAAEVWLRNNRQTTLSFPWPKDRMGPVGFLGVPPSTFHGTITLGTVDSGAHPEISNFVIPDDRYGIGPRGLLGIPVRRFKESERFAVLIVTPTTPTSVFFWVD